MRKIVTLIITITTFAAFGQTSPTLNYSNPTPFIEVTGTAQKEVVPDQIYISILLTEKRYIEPRFIEPLYIAKKRRTMRPSLTENSVHPNLRISEPQYDSKKSVAVTFRSRN